MNRIYLVKYDIGKFQENTLVKLEAVSDSGECYLVSRFPEQNEREWVMYYDLYKFIEKGETSQRWWFDEKHDKTIRSLLNM